MPAFRLNELQALKFQAGQKLQETIYGATITIFGVEIPCTHSEIMTDFDLVPGGKSPKTFVQSVTFRREMIPDESIPKKGERFTLDMGGGIPILNLKLYEGGLQPGGFIYVFKAVDANYSA